MTGVLTDAGERYLMLDEDINGPPVYVYMDGETRFAVPEEGVNTWDHFICEECRTLLEKPAIYGIEVTVECTHCEYKMERTFSEPET
jgi:hypothetical protein